MKMISGEDFIEATKSFFFFLETEFGFKLAHEKKRDWLFYDIEYKNLDRAISISYEPREDYLLVIVFCLTNGEKPDYDDKNLTLHLNALNKTILPNIGKKQFDENENLFAAFEAKDALRAQLLKSAKELRLCLKYGKILNLS